MLRSFTRFLLVPALLCSTLSQAQTAAKPMNLKVRIRGLAKDSIVLLANYYGDKQFIQDTVKADAAGNVLFKSDKPMERGIYLVVIPSKKNKFFEVILTENQNFSMETDTSANAVQNMKVTGSPENKIFYDYLQYISLAQKRLSPLTDKKKKFEEQKNKDSVAAVQKKIDDLDLEVKAYKLAFIKNNPENFMAKVFRAMREPEIPKEIPAPYNANDSLKKVFSYLYYKAHFFDGMDWTEEGLVRTPVFHNNLVQYMDKLTPQHPDSIILACDYLIGKAKGCKEQFKYTTHHLTYKYETIKVMCFDRIFVHLVDKYYKTGQAFWLDEKQTEKIIKRADQLRYSLCDNNPANMILQDTLGKTVSLQQIKAKYTIIAFWEPSCSHCKKEMPILKKEYDELKKYGLEIFAMNTEDDPAAWRKFIRENKLNWINGIAKDAQERATYKYYYDIYSTPVLFLLDENKKIIAKRLDPIQMGNVIRKKEKLPLKPEEKKTGADKQGHN
ncbi:MAG: alkyl hydroperoxide reductase/thiol specific antioxidant/Mal allergen [Bacteroidetes bacterium]|nr:MAG: alkyl hydroperoxide reductase/thiol specific antioxidant/Mal allergen [Bacteroidota bacterium]